MRHRWDRWGDRRLQSKPALVKPLHQRWLALETPVAPTVPKQASAGEALAPT